MGSAISCFTGPKFTAQAGPIYAIPTNQANLNLSVATPTDHASGIIEVPSNSHSDDPFRLLDLPAELVGRITSFVNTEALIPVRLTCKALEAITFDRFAAENFGHIYCWVATTDDFKRLGEIVRQSPRLSSRIRQLTLSTDPLRELPRSSIAYARRESEDEDRALTHAIQHLNGVDNPSYVDVINVLHTLKAMQRLTQDIFIAVDLYAVQAWLLRSGNDYSPLHTYKYLPQQMILFSLAISRLQIHSLRVDQDTFSRCGVLQAVTGADLLAPMSTLTTLDIGRVYRENLAIHVDLLRGTLRLQNLGFNADPDDQVIPSMRIYLVRLEPELLLANHLSCLVSLTSTRVVLDARSLVMARTRCRNTLTYMVLRHVSLSTNDNDLESVYQATLAMTILAFLELQWQKTGIQPYEIYDLPHDEVRPESHMCEGIKPVKQWLQELLHNHLSLHHEKPCPVMH